MRYFFTLGAILTLLAGILLSMPSAHAAVSIYDYANAQEDDSFVAEASDTSSAASVTSPYPYFRRTGSSSSSSSRVTVPVRQGSSSSRSSSSRSTSSRSSSSSRSSLSAVPSPVTDLSEDPKVGIYLEAEPADASPGQIVRYHIKLKNLSYNDLPAWKVAFFFDRNELEIVQVGRGKGDGDHITYNVPAMQSNAEMSFTVTTRVRPGMDAGQSIRTYASMIWDGAISPACSKNDLLVTAPIRFVETGVGDATEPVEDLKQFLRPMRTPAANGGWFSWLW